MEEIRECIVCGKEFVAKQYKSNTCSKECWKVHRTEYFKKYSRTPERIEYMRKLHKKQTKAERERQERIKHQQDRTVWTPDYGERQRQTLVEQYARVNVQAILEGMRYE